MRILTVRDKTVTVFPSQNPGAPVLYLNTFGEEGQQVFAELHRMQPEDFSLVAICGLDWNREMVPWDSPPVFPKGEPCTGGADEYLTLLTQDILPAAEKELAGPPRWRGLAGYSLAGLFAVYALYGTDRFSRAASMSGSLWFPGIQEFIFSHTMQRVPDRLYFSLGAKENKTRNPVLRTVRDRTEAIQAYYEAQGIRTTLQIHPGNHYYQTVERTAAGLAWLLQP